MKRICSVLMIAAMLLSFAACGKKSGSKSLYEIVVVPAAWSDELDTQIKVSNATTFVEI